MIEITPEIQKLYDEYQREFDEAYEICREDYIITQEDYDSWPAQQKHHALEVGTKTTRFKQNVSTCEEGLELLKNGYARVQFVVNKQTHLSVYGGWDLDSIDTEINQIEDCIREASTVSTTIENKGGVILYNRFSPFGLREYQRLKNGYYNTHMMTWEQLTPSSQTAWAYGRLVLFYEFLLNERKKYFDKKDKVPFSKHSMIEQLDLVLKCFSKELDFYPNCNIQTAKKGLERHVNFDPNFHDLYCILKKLENDGFINRDTFDTTNISTTHEPIKSVEDRYWISWEGRYFISNDVGGYQKKVSDDLEKERHRDHMEKYALGTNILIAVGVLIAAVYYYYQLHDGTLQPHPCASVISLSIILGLGILTLVLLYLRKTK